MSKHISNQVVTFDNSGLWSFDNDFIRNVVTFAVDNSSSSYSDNRKNNFSISGEGPTYDINGSFGSPEKKFNINFTKVNTRLCLSLHYNADNSYLFALQLNFVPEVFLMDLVILSLEKYL